MVGQGDGPARVYPGKSPYAMKSMEECISTVCCHTGVPLEAVALPLDQALNHVLASDIAAPAPVPPYPTSIMDGFAMRAADGPGCYPVDMVEGATAGGPAKTALAAGHVRYITTGALLPEGADAVVKVEDTREALREGGLEIDIRASPAVGANIRQVGSDTRKGEVVLRRGTKIGAGEVGVLAALGYAQVEVHRRPRVAVLSTGDELVDVERAGSQEELKGQIVDCNRPMLRAQVAEAGASPLDFGIVRDDPGLLREKLKAALAAADVVVTSGGVSRGSKDHVKPLLEELGQVHFGEMCMKPGKPTTFATVPPPPEAGERQRLVFALPGNPVSCFVTFKLMVVPAIEQLGGQPRGVPTYSRVDAELLQPVAMDPERPEYHRALARWEAGRIVAESTGFQRSSRIASVAGANCLLEIPRQAGTLPRGTAVKALLLPRHEAVLGMGDGYPPKEPKELHEVHPPHAVGPEVVEKWRVGLLTVGADCAAAREEALGCLRFLGVDAALESVPLEAAAVRAVVEAWSQSCDLIVVLGRLGLGEAEHATAEAIRKALDRSVPGVADAVLRAGLPRSQLVMLEQAVAGMWGQSLVVTVPAVAPSESLQAIWPLLRHLARSPSSVTKQVGC